MTTYSRSIDRVSNKDGSAKQATLDTESVNFFSGYLQTHQNRDPYVSGYAFIKWLKVPKWITTLDATDPTTGSDVGNEFTTLSETNFKSFSGLGTMQLDVGALTAGFTGNETSFAKGTMQKAEGFTLKYQVTSGSDLCTYYNHWVGGIRDPKTGIATYPKDYGIEYHSKNHTGILLYVVTRPDADKWGANIIEFASVYTNVMPTKIIQDHFNFEGGSHEFAEVEQEFKGYMHYGRKVTELAYSYMKTESHRYAIGSENEFADASSYSTRLSPATT